MLNQNYLLFVFLMLCSFAVSAQEMATVKGTIKSPFGVGVKNTNIVLKGLGKGVVTDSLGRFSIQVPANETVRLRFSNAQYQTKNLKFKLTPNEVKTIKPVFKFRSLGPIKIIARQQGVMIDEIEVLDINDIVSTSGNFEDLVKTGFVGVSSANELSSGYNVRGGNFEENLIYVNDIEIYRPFLARSGQQEGLSFINSSMVESIQFSAGGFEAKYGDKLSSVLDVRYKKSSAFGGRVSASLLGANAHLEGLSKNQLWTHTTAVRYRTNRYLLGALDTKGDYKPTFADLQTYITYTPNENWEHSFLGNYALNRYRVVPQNRETSFGSINQALRFTVFFNGQEITDFQTFTGAYAAKNQPNDSTTYKFIASAFRTMQNEHFDVEGQYLLDELERDPGSDNFGDVAFNIGVGGFLRHARNQLDATVVTLQHKGEKRIRKYNFKWGAKAQYDVINDQLKEWNLTDSAGFIAPRQSDSVGYTDSTAQPYQYLVLEDVLRAKNTVESMRFSGYVQNTWNLSSRKNISLNKKRVVNDTTYAIDTALGLYSGFNITTGVRSNYWNFNNQVVVSPRVAVSYRPGWLFIDKNGELKRRNVSFKAAVGVYHQPPFYREYRRLDGTLNKNIKAQRALHFVIGGDYIFNMWNKPFKLTTETYYKYLTNVIPYNIDNVRVRYLANNDAKAYAQGIDLKLNGKFISDMESWATLSIMQTKIDLGNDRYYTYLNQAGDTIVSGVTFDQTVTDSLPYSPSYIPRPTDQRVSFGLFFQDKMPKSWNTGQTKWETFKVNMNIVFATGFSYLSKKELANPAYQDNSIIPRTPRYIRVDIGFVKDFISANNQSKRKFFKHIKTLSLSLEIFNLLGIDNTVSYNFIQATNGRDYAIPNRLTSRRFNLKLTASF